MEDTLQILRARRVAFCLSLLYEGAPTFPLRRTRFPAAPRTLATNHIAAVYNRVYPPLGLTLGTRRRDLSPATRQARADRSARPAHLPPRIPVHPHHPADPRRLLFQNRRR